VQAGKHPEPRGSRRDEPPSSPLARRLAREEGIDYTQLRGTGSSGRIRKADVLEAVKARAAHAQPQVRPLADMAGIARSIPVSPTRRTIAARIDESLRRTAPVTLTTTADVTNLVALRQQFKAAAQPGLQVPSFLDFTVKLTALALRDHPTLNAHWPHGTDHINVPESAHIGIAVDTEAGLLVPVIHDAAALGVQQIAALSGELVRRAKEGRLSSTDMQGGTFTITNLGGFGIETFTPIINPPECAILGMGKIERRAVMEGDHVVARDRMYLSLTFDHRIVDGAPSARFLQRLVQLLENPAPWLMP
jgi:pyruvate dehydrogenase E2 component (dihydrolipoamide acetyltransferase)